MKFFIIIMIETEYIKRKHILWSNMKILDEQKGQLSI